MPDGKGGRNEYHCKMVYRLFITSSGVYQLIEHGLICHRLDLSGVSSKRHLEPFVTVESVMDTGRMDDTYCVNEPHNHAVVFNGILTGNCTEIMEYSAPDESAVCNLASLALPAYVNTTTKTFDYAMLRSVVKVAIRNLNRVIDINYYPTPETQRSNLRHRPIGAHGHAEHHEVRILHGVSQISLRPVRDPQFQHPRAHRVRSVGGDDFARSGTNQSGNLVTNPLRCVDPIGIEP
jgi:hypothetical protein